MGAIVTRAIIIGLGVELIHSFDWLSYIFGLFIVYIGFKSLFVDNEDFDVSDTIYYRLIKKILPIKWDYSGSNFYIKIEQGLYFTPLFVALIVVEISDIIFAFDSIPAIISITTDPFIVYSSNLFAILGLRSLYFILAEVVDRFVHLTKGVSAILIIVGVKILLKDFFHFSETFMLLVIAVIFLVSIITSVNSLRKNINE